MFCFKLRNTLVCELLQKLNTYTLRLSQSARLIQNILTNRHEKTLFTRTQKMTQIFFSFFFIRERGYSLLPESVDSFEKKLEIWVLVEKLAFHYYFHLSAVNRIWSVCFTSILKLVRVTFNGNNNNNNIKQLNSTDKLLKKYWLEQVQKNKVFLMMVLIWVLKLQ